MSEDDMMKVIRLAVGKDQPPKPADEAEAMAVAERGAQAGNGAPRDDDAQEREEIKRESEDDDEPKAKAKSKPQLKPRPEQPQQPQPRPRIQRPREKIGPLLPVMDTLNVVMDALTMSERPPRDIDDVSTRLRKLSLPKMHAFDQTQVNAGDDGDDPAPEQWVLHRMNEMEVAEMIEQYVDFVDNNGKSVRLPSIFVRHFRQRFDDVCPTVVAIATLPIVLADGVLLAPEGLDPLRGIAFKIQPELRAVLPRREDCDDDAVRRAMKFLTDEWLCDVATDYAGKCTLISAALSLIERSLFPDRPCYFVTAGRRGGGKTTTLTMLIMAVTGIWPAAAAWSTNEEERRKALLSYFLYGVSYILWDNIARGAQISCPHIEKSCTAAFYSDRRLGVSEMVATAAAVIHFFSGNNIGPRGDLASRSLQVRLVVDRTDPENRTFKHPDPVGWTEDNRAEILRALYTILLGNPALKLPRDAVFNTRFKMWYRVVGAAVEHAARLVKKEATDPVKRETADEETRKKMDEVAAQQDVDFRKLFLTQETEGDEDTVSLGSALAVMRRRWVKFKASDIADLINGEGRDSSLFDNEGGELREMKRDGATRLSLRGRACKLRGNAGLGRQPAQDPSRRAGPVWRGDAGLTRGHRPRWRHGLLRPRRRQKRRAHRRLTRRGEVCGGSGVCGVCLTAGPVSFPYPRTMVPPRV